MKKKKLKGFTLVELIVVMAIFGIIMVAVMSLIDPVSKIMKRTTLEEANAASVDNVKHYLEGSLKFANAIEVHMGSLQGNDVDPATGKHEKIDDSNMDEAVIDFANEFYLNKTGLENIPRTERNLYNGGDDNQRFMGKIHVMKVDNANGGRVNEYVYDFVAGYSTLEPSTPGGDFDTEKDYDATLEDWDNSANPSDPGPDYLTVNEDVINPIYYENYSFFIEPGYKELLTTNIPASDRDHYTVTFKDVERTAADGSTIAYDSFSQDMFSMSVVTYKNKQTYPAVADDTATPGVNETKLFESPAAISNISMSLVNLNSKFAMNNQVRDYSGPLRYEGFGMYNGVQMNMLYNTTVDLDGDGNWDYLPWDQLSNKQSQQPFVVKDDWESESPNFYFIYTLPDAK